MELMMVSQTLPEQTIHLMQKIWETNEGDSYVQERICHS